MHLTGLALTNWTRFRGEHVLELGPGVYAVVADHEGDQSRSNARGKTAFLTSIRWLLEGGRMLDMDSVDDLVCRGEEECVVEGEFSNGVYVRRAKNLKDSEKLLVVVPDAEAEGGERRLYQADAQAELDRIVGFSREDRLTTCFAEQQEVAALVKAKTAEATSTFGAWLELERVVEAGDWALKWLSEVVTNLASEVERLNDLEQLARPDAVAEIEAQLAAARDAADAADAEHDRVLELVKTRADGVAKAELEEDITSVQDELAALPTYSKKLPDVAKHERASAGTEAARVNAEKEVHRLKLLETSGFDGACPVSPGFACPATAEINQRCEKNVAARKRAEGILANMAKMAKDERDLLNQARAEVAAEARNKDKLASLEKRLADLRARRARYAGAEAWSRGDDGEFPPAPDLPARGNRTAVELLERGLKERRDAASRLEGARQRVAELRAKAAAHRLAARILGPEVTLRRVVEGSVSGVALAASEALVAADVDLWVEPQWGREVGKPADSCASCGHPFPASAKFKQCSSCFAPRGMKVRHEFRFRVRSRTAATSGGNRDMAGLALRAAAFRWLKERRGAEWGIALLDEPLQQLDDSNRAAAVASVSRLLGAFEQAFLTAHHRGSLDAMPRRIVISGVGEDSTVRAVGYNQ